MSQRVKMNQRDYIEYYLDQLGNGMSGIGSVYRRPRYQSGRGIGSLFSGIVRSLKPLMKSTAKAIGKQTLKTGKRMVRSIGKQSFKDSFKENGKRMLQALADKSVEQIEKFNNMSDPSKMDFNEVEEGQEGSGTSLSFGFSRRKKGFKRRAKLSTDQSIKRAKRDRKKAKFRDIFSK